MNRPVELRSPQQGWLKVLRLAYPFLREQSLGDLTVFGSQAMSVFMKTGLRSKDLDFLSAQMGPKHQDNLGKLLAGTTGIEVRSRTVQTKSLPKGEMKIYSIELRLEERPLIIEVFDKILDGRPISLLAPHVQQVKKWGLNLWVPSPNAIVALRLAFRRPEGISRLNGARLNAFIRENRRRLDFKEVRSTIQQWGMGEVVEANLEDLRKRHRMRMLYGEDILARIRSGS